MMRSLVSSVLPAKSRGCPGKRSQLCVTNSAQRPIPLAGLVPATHVFAAHSVDRQEGVDGRDKPGQGGSGVVPRSLHESGNPAAAETCGGNRCPRLDNALK